jgi:hypothetical protein
MRYLNVAQILTPSNNVLACLLTYEKPPGKQFFWGALAVSTNARFRGFLLFLLLNPSYLKEQLILWLKNVF